jgi:UDP-4-amino-4,6-dideoxy-N-acetyl-beta-L-altrosamine N-acetyltransferase
MAHRAGDGLRTMREADLGQVLVWRNHPDVRRHMFTRHELGMEEHVRWFQKAAADPLRRLLIFEAAGEPAGFVNLACIAPPAVWDWGFYVAPGSPGGTGRRLGEIVLRTVFEEMHAHRLCAQVLSSNERSLRFHETLGFTREGLLRAHHHDGNGYQDVVCFGLLQQEFGRRGGTA